MDDNKSFAYNVTHGVAIEEMLHMTDAANLLNAIGGAPGPRPAQLRAALPDRDADHQRELEHRELLAAHGAHL